jgi:hypothetical protein
MFYPSNFHVPDRTRAARPDFRPVIDNPYFFLLKTTENNAGPGSATQQIDIYLRPQRIRYSTLGFVSAGRGVLLYSTGRRIPVAIRRAEAHSRRRRVAGPRGRKGLSPNARIRRTPQKGGHALMSRWITWAPPNPRAVPSVRDSEPPTTVRPTGEACELGSIKHWLRLVSGPNVTLFFSPFCSAKMVRFFERFAKYGNNVWLEN